MTTATEAGPLPGADAEAIRFRGVTKEYGTVRAVDRIDLSVRRGETVALLGPNGAGKSTSINMLLGLLPPDSGEITVFGKTPERAMRAGLVGAMLQEGRPVARLTVRELVDFIRRTYPDPLPLDELLRLARLSDLAGRRASKLSGGQIQRVRFALAIAGDPDLVVLDEPTAALDVEARRDLWAALHDYADRGKSVLFSTHYLQEADEVADRIIVISGGVVVADGSSADIKSRISGRTISIDAGACPMDVLERLPMVTSVEVRGDRVFLRSTDSDATVVALAVEDAVRNLEVTSGGLEEAFIALTHDRRTDNPKAEL